MSDSLPSPDFDDELLSAYADGELTDAERAQVEERLAADVDARQLVEELRAMSATLRSMPREALNRDLRGAVWSKVQTGEAASAAGASANTVLNNSESQTIDRWSGYKRGFIWSALAIAAALLLVVFQPHEDKLDKESLAKAGSHGDRDADREPQRQAASSNAAETAGQLQNDKQNAPRLEAVPPSSSPASVLAAGGLAKQDGLPVEKPSAAGLAVDQLSHGAAVPYASPEQLSTIAGKQAAPSSTKTVQLRLASPKGLEQFEKTLTESGIAFSDDPTPVGSTAAFEREVVNPAAGTGLVRRFGADDSRGALRDEAASSRAIAAESPPSGANSAGAAPGQETLGRQEAVLVEASRDQIEHVLAHCRADRRAFAQVPAFDAIASAKPASSESDGSAIGGASGERKTMESLDSGDLKDRLALHDESVAGRSLGPAAATASPPAPTARIAEQEAQGQVQPRGRAWRVAFPSQAAMDSYAMKSVGGRGGGDGRFNLSQRQAKNKESSADASLPPPADAVNESSTESPILVLFLLQRGDEAPAH